MNQFLNRVKIRSIVLNLTSFEKLQTTTKTGISRKNWASFESTNHIHFKWFFPGFGLKKFSLPLSVPVGGSTRNFFLKNLSKTLLQESGWWHLHFDICPLKGKTLKKYPPRKISWKCRHGSEYANGLWRAKLKGGWTFLYSTTWH